MAKLSLKDVAERAEEHYVANAREIDHLHDRVAAVYADLNLVEQRLSAAPEQDDLSDLRLRSEAVREATVRVKAIYPADVQINSDLVDEVIKVAAFLLGEPNGNAPVNNYIDQYHYHYDGSGAYVPTVTDRTPYIYDTAGYIAPNPF